VVADGISCKWEGLPRQTGDGSKWTVCEDLEANTGLTNDILNISINNETNTLWKCFKNELAFAEMIDALLTIKSSKSVCNQHRAQYRVLQYMIEDNKLWWLRGEIAICG
jgi:hypothetical protein